MSTYSELYTVVQSMTKAEKRYFRLMSSVRGDEKDYVAMFDFIERQPSPKEGDLKLAFGNLSAKQLASLKTYLMKQVLRSLNILYMDSDVTGELKGLIKSCEILFDKGLYSLAQKYVKKALKMAEKYELLHHFTEIFEWEYKLVNFTHDYDRMQGVMRRTDKLAGDMALYYKMKNVRTELLLEHFKKVYVDHRMESEVLNELLNGNNESRIDESDFEFNTRINYYGLRIIYYRLIRNEKKQMELSEELYKYMSINRKKAINFPKIYIEASHSYIISLLINGRYEQAVEESVKLKQFPTQLKLKGIGINASTFTYSSMGQLAGYLGSADFEKCLALIPEVSKGLEQYGNEIPDGNKSVLNYNVFSTYYALENYREALQWMNKILNETAIGIGHKDVYESIRILSLIVHLELGNTDLLDYLIRSIDSYFSKIEERRSRSWKRLTIMHFKKLVAAKSMGERNNEFRKLKEQLISILKDPKIKTSMTIYQVLIWLDCKLEGSKYAEIEYEKFKEYSAKER